MKIKIIDLLVKIANNEEVPKHIKCNNLNLYWNDENYTYDIREDKLYAPFNIFDYSELNNEAEIIEEPKKIEKIEMYQDEEGHYFLNKQYRKVYVNCDEMDFMVDKFNELIDEINNLKKSDE